jgi:predicted O-methyltransferase YrrM
MTNLELEVGRLLQVLAAGKPGGQIWEHGPGAGVGTAWLASGLSADTQLISAEVNPVDLWPSEWVNTTLENE